MRQQSEERAATRYRSFSPCDHALNIMPAICVVPLMSTRPAVAAGLRLQHGFEARHSRDECAQMIEEYAALGGDENLTEDCLVSGMT